MSGMGRLGPGWGAPKQGKVDQGRAEETLEGCATVDLQWIGKRVCIGALSSADVGPLIPGGV